jgi:Na+-driven multidrug efflux pump
LASSIRHNSWKIISSLFFPVFVFALLENAEKFVERICLSHYSLDFLNGSMQAYALLQFFQVSLVIFANRISIFEGKTKALEIGNRVWQVIWLSMLSMIVVLPFTPLINVCFFQEIGQGEIASRYFSISLIGSFLFPIGAILSSFFRAVENKRFLLSSLIIAVQASVILNLLLIPSFGVMGAAYSGLIAKFIFCSILLGRFLNRSNRENYHTHEWKMDWLSIWHSIKSCDPKIIGRTFYCVSWMILTYFMATKGNVHLSVLSVGATLTFFAVSFPQSLLQSFSSVFAHELRSQSYSNAWKIFKSGLLCALTFSGILAIPFLCFPKSVLFMFFSEIPSGLENQLITTVHWAWVWILIRTLHPSFLFYLFSLRDELFYKRIRLFTHLLSILLAGYFIYYLNGPPNTFWVVLCVECTILLSAYAIRTYALGKEQIKKGIDRAEKTTS